MNEVEFFNETEEQIAEFEEVKNVISYAISYLKLEHLEFNIILVNNERIHEINKEYRNVDRPTDVISFALEDNSEIKLEGNRVLGDIYISIDKAREQAKEYGHSLLRELSFLAVHGFLHLLGYDHMKKEEEEVMFKLQEEILDEMDIKR